MVSQRTTELGLRIALGAQRADILLLIFLRGFWLSLIGLCAGTVAAVLVTHFLAGLLYAVRPLDVGTFVQMSLLLLAVSCAAALLPAYHASRLQPTEVL
jgi:ABC-type antimicrobial peptide transport system permease subunit